MVKIGDGRAASDVVTAGGGVTVSGRLTNVARVRVAAGVALLPRVAPLHGGIAKILSLTGFAAVAAVAEDEAGTTSSEDATAGEVDRGVPEDVGDVYSETGGSAVSASIAIRRYGCGGGPPEQMRYQCHGGQWDSRYCR